MRRAQKWYLMVLLLAVCMAACAQPNQDTTITVASANSTEHLLAGQLTVQLLRARGFTVVDKTGYGQPWAVRTALEAGAIDVCWEFTGETWLSHLAHDQPISDPAKAWECLQTEDAARRIVWVAQAGYHSTLVMWVRQDLATANQLVTLSDLSGYTRSINARTRLCVPQEAYESAQGLKGLSRAYSLSFDAGLVRTMPASDGYRALSEGQCDCALASSLEESAAAGPLSALQDDRGFFQASNLAVAVRASVLAQSPEVGEALTALAEALTQENATALYRQVTVERKDLAKVAREFLKEHKLLRKPGATPTAQP